MKDFKKLNVWQKGIDLVDSIYKLSKLIPVEEKYGLISQFTRAAISIPSNIAEGSSRSSDKDFARFLQIALGSSFELETQLIIIERQNFAASNEVYKRIEETKTVQKMLSGLIKKLGDA